MRGLILAFSVGPNRNRLEKNFGSAQTRGVGLTWLITAQNARKRIREMSNKVTLQEASGLVEWTVERHEVIGRFPENQGELSRYQMGIYCISTEYFEGITSPSYEAYFQELPIDERSGVRIAYTSKESLEDAKSGVVKRLVEEINGEAAEMNRWMSHEDIREDYIRRAEERNPGKGKEIGEIYLVLKSNLLLMKHRFSEYKKMRLGDKVDRKILHHYLRRFYHDAGNAFLDGVILEINNFIVKKGAKDGKQLSLYSFLHNRNDNMLEKKVLEIEDKANNIIQRRHNSIAHWGKKAIIEGEATPISIDEVDCVIELITEAMDYIGENLLGLNHFTEKSESFDPWELIVAGGVEHVIAYLKHYEWLSYKQREYAKNGEPFLSPSWFDIFNSTEQAEEERRKQRERILALIDT